MKRKRLKSLQGASLATQARPYAPAALAELVRIMTCSRSDHARIAACNALLDRAFGRPPPAQSLATADAPRPPPLRKYETMSPEELREEYARLCAMPAGGWR
jgi:hypothetical protein